MSLLVWLSTTIVGQTKPNYTGEWELVQAKSKDVIRLRVSQDNDKVRIEKFSNGARTSELEYALDGKTKVLRQKGDIITSGAATWKNGRLHLTTTIGPQTRNPVVDVPIKVDEDWELVGGNLQVESKTSGSIVQQRKSKDTYVPVRPTGESADSPPNTPHP